MRPSLDPGLRSSLILRICLTMLRIQRECLWRQVPSRLRLERIRGYVTCELHSSFTVSRQCRQRKRKDIRESVHRDSSPAHSGHRGVTSLPRRNTPNPVETVTAGSDSRSHAYGRAILRYSKTNRVYLKATSHRKGYADALTARAWASQRRETPLWPTHVEN